MSNDMNLGYIESISEYIILFASDGSILSGQTGLNIKGDIIQLNSASSIGALNKPLEVDIGQHYLTANATNGLINIQENTGDLKVEALYALNNDVFLSTVDGSILDPYADESNINVYGINVTLTTNGTDATIGTASEDLDITTTGIVNATSDGLININETDGTLNLGQIQSNNNVIIVSDGNILDADLTNEPYNISANNISLTSTNGSIGTSLTNGDIDINASGNLNAVSNTNSYLSGNITGSISATGTDIYLESDSDISIGTIISVNNTIINSFNANITDGLAGEGSNISAANLLLSATKGSIGETDDININLANTLDAWADGAIKIQSNAILGINQVQSLNNGDISLVSDNFNITGDSSIITSGNVVLSRRSAGDFEISDIGNITPQGISKINCNIIIGNNNSTNELTNNIYIKNNVYTDGDPLELSAIGAITIDDNVIVSSRNLLNVWLENHNTAPSQGNSGDIILNGSEINLNAGSGLFSFANNNYSGGNVEIIVDNNINSQGYLKVASAKLQANTINSNGMIMNSIDGNSCLFAETLNVISTTNISSSNNIGLIADNFNIDATTSLNAYDSTIFSRATEGNIEISDIGNITIQDLGRVNGSITLGNHIDTNNLTNNISIKSNISNGNNSLTLNVNSSIYNNEGSLMAANINLIATTGTLGTVNDYIVVESNNSIINMNAYGDIFLDSLYGNNSYSLKSTTGTTYLKMHNNNPVPISNIIIPTPPVIEEPTTPEVINNIIEKPDPPEIVINDPVEEILTVENNVIDINNNTKLPVKHLTARVNNISQPVTKNIEIDTTTQSVLNKAIITYNEALLTSIDNNHAINMAIDILLDANISKEEAEKLIDNALIIDSAYIELLEHFVSLNKVSIEK